MRVVAPVWRRRAAQFVAGAMVAALATVSPSSPAVGAPPGAGEGDNAVPGQLVVGYDPGATDRDRARARGRSEATLEDRVVAGRGATGEVELVRLPPGKERSAAVREIESDPSVAYAEPNWIYTHTATSTDPKYTDGSLWGMYGDNTTPKNDYGSQSGETWAAGNTGGKEVFVGVIDEGIQYDHPDLAGQVWTNPYDPVDGVDNNGNGYVDDVRGWDFANNDNTIYDGGTKGSLDDHGTHVAGTIGAKADGAGVVGVNWNVTLVSGKFLGSRGGTLANAIKAVDYFTDLKTRHGLNIVATNNSWGGGGFSQGLLDAITRAARQNILFIAAAGNGGSDGVGDDNDAVASYPSNYDTTSGAGYDAVVAVAAITSSGAKAGFSNYGAETVDLGAPGSGVLSTTAYNTYSSYSGTSMATPHVTGGVALYAAANPGATSATTRSAILSATVPTASLTGKTVTGGRLNVSGFATTTTPSEPTAPSEPANLSATGGNGTVDLAWSAPLSDGGSSITGYKVYRDGLNVATTGPSVLSFADTGLLNGTTYSYHVTAVNELGESSPSNLATATPSDAPARSVTLTAGPKKKNLTDVTVTWVGFSGTHVDVTRSGSTFATENDGTLTETWRGSGTVTYTVCETGSTTACETASTNI